MNVIKRERSGESLLPFLSELPKDSEQSTQVGTGFAQGPLGGGGLHFVPSMMHSTSSLRLASCLGTSTSLGCQLSMSRMMKFP